MIDTHIVIPPLVEAYLNEVTRKFNPGAKIVLKSQSRLMKVIGWCLKSISPTFMENYITTLGNTIYVPDGYLNGNKLRVLEVIAHESIHIRDFTKNPVWFVLSYLAPQILAPLALFSLGAVFWSPWWLLCLLFLGFLAPVPAPGRYHWEKRAYRVSVIMARQVFGYTEAEMSWLRKFIIVQLATQWYYWTWPFPAMIETELEDETIISGEEYKELIRFINRHNLNQ